MDELTVVMTAYNSVPEQTDDTPFITATMTRTRPGVIAVSRDLRDGRIPYGSRVRIKEILPGHGCNAWMPGTRGILPELFIAEDTMAARKRMQVDVWLPEVPQALEWGRCQAVVQVVTDAP